MIASALTAPARGWFVPGKTGPLYFFFQPPLAARPRTTRAVLMIPPFAEEMNKSRRMLALQARRLAADGVAALLLDLSGTGDSAGEFADARWESWRADVATGYDWLRAQGIDRIEFLGVRLGAMLALDVVRHTALGVGRVALWQPVVSGEAMLSQFLRIRVAASMMASDKEKESTQQLQQALRSGQSIEVGGYELTPELAAAIEPLRLDRLVDNGSPPIDWLEIVPDHSQTVSPASRRVVDAWQARGVDVRAAAVAGAPFWSSVEITTVPALVEITAERFRAESNPT